MMEQVVGSGWRDQWRLDCRTLKPDDWLSTVLLIPLSAAHEAAASGAAIYLVLR